uniref:hypothetical protein n=1 Tax=Parolsenella massiliensis TaxID=1871022 RepID=UPI0009354048|nr:hypothetical protein [Parolsenella massiliensis]
MNLLTMAQDPACIDVEPTERLEKMVLEGEPKNYRVCRIKLDLLRYNEQNDRIATFISRYKAEHGDDSFEGLTQEEYNSIVQDFIVESNPEAIKKTRGNIELRTQERPGVVLSNGLVIDGNRRFTCLRQLAQKNPSFGMFDAVILPYEVGNDPKRVKILELSIQHATEEKVEYDLIDKLVGVYRDILDPETKLLTVEEYAKYADASLKDVSSWMQLAQFMVDFLDYVGQPKQFHIARELSLGSLFQEMPAILKKCSSSEQEEQVKNILFANLVMSAEGDRVRIIRPVKQVLTSEKAEEFVECESDLAAEVCERLSMGDTSFDERIADVRADADLAGEFRRTLDSAVSAARREKAVSSPADAIEKAMRDLMQVEEGIFGELDSNELATVKRGVSGLKKRLSAIEDALLAAER